jgi:hypothetical protein
METASRWRVSEPLGRGRDSLVGMSGAERKVGRGSGKGGAAPAGHRAQSRALDAAGVAFIAELPEAADTTEDAARALVEIAGLVTGRAAVPCALWQRAFPADTATEALDGLHPLEIEVVA